MASTKRPEGGTRPAKKSSSAASSDASKRPRLRSSHGAPPAAPAKKTTARGATKTRPAAAARPTAAKAGPASRREAPKPKRERAAREPASGAGSQASDQARELAVLVAIAALEKKASNLEVIDVAGRVDYADFLVLMSGRSDRHVASLSQAIEDALGKKGHRALSVEGLPHATWVLMDYGDVVVHAFQEDARSLYDVDGLWTDARRIPLPADSRETV